MESIKTEKQEYDCAICYNMITRPSFAPCGHKFCAKCLKSVLAYNFKCPMCRASIPSSFQPVVDSSLRKKIQDSFPIEFRQIEAALAKQDLAEKNKRSLKLLFGNRYQYLEDASVSRDGQHMNCHRWTAFVELHDKAADISEYIKKVVFQLDRDFMNPTREITHAPFEVSCNGWGTFTIKMTVHWKKDINKPASTLSHLLIFNANTAPKPFVLEYEVVPKLKPFLA